ncbi:MAG TPA: low temperature requirement protein A [Candidatus Acidoferrum sp.]|nr:low temperature requirement protein A [Candidatus Acidoferrum sp.]
MPGATLLRANSGVRGVTNTELFFDLVYAFAVTQLSHYLIDHATVEGALQTALLLAMVWVVWASTAYLANWLDPSHVSVRLLLFGIMLASLVMSAGLPEAFGVGGIAVGGAYAAMQIGRCLFSVFAFRGQALERNFQRLLIWATASGALAVIGGLQHGHVRELLWTLVVGIDLFSAGIGFWIPGLGRTETREWVLDGAHVAERNQAFILIALGETIVIIGASLASLRGLSGEEILAYLVAFAGTALLWWVYFDRSAAFASRAIAASRDPGRLARSAFYWIHPLMIGGIIVAAAGDRLVIAGPTQTGDVASTLIVLGGPALFLAGHALFKVAVFRSGWPWSRITAIVILGLLIPVGLAAPALALSASAVGAVAVVVVLDRRHRPTPEMEALYLGEARVARPRSR